MTRARRHDLTQ